MEYLIKHRPSFALLEIRLNQNEKITAEAGALIYMESGIEVKTRTREGGLFQGQLLMQRVQAKVLVPETQKLKHLS